MFYRINLFYSSTDFIGIKQELEHHEKATSCSNKKFENITTDGLGYAL